MAFASVLGYSFQGPDLVVLATLVLLEAVLSFDNAAIIAALVRRLPRDQRRRALLYGLVGAYTFRLLVILLASRLVANPWLRALGGAYLLFLALPHFTKRRTGPADIEPRRFLGLGLFASTILTIEAADLVFALDQVVVAVALTPKVVLVVVASFAAILALRFSALYVVRLMDWFPPARVARPRRRRLGRGEAALRAIYGHRGPDRLERRCHHVAARGASPREGRDRPQTAPLATDARLGTRAKTIKPSPYRAAMGKAATVVPMSKGATRTEKDSLGAFEVPAERYYGVQTMRAVTNFPISGLRLPRRFIRAQGLIKAAAAHANQLGGALDKAKADAIKKAALEVADGKWDAEFVVDVYQAGAGTSQNMNANEVIANRALELLGQPKGAYDKVNPNDEVNRGQSTNDTIPTAILVSARESIELDLRPALKRLTQELEKKVKEYAKVIKAGRTHLQDATPLTLGQEFSGYVHFLKESDRRLAQASEALSYLPLGGTAVGTGINTVPNYDVNAVKELSKLSGLEFRVTPNKFAGQQNVEAALEASSALRSLATSLNKIADDFRLLASGPRTGFYEIELPTVQPGSSIMPGKVNPVLAEMMNMVCEQAFGHDATIHHAIRSAQLELNVMMPVIGYNLLQCITILTNAMEAFSTRAVKDLKVNEEICRMYLDRSLMLVTALTPKIGYLKAAEVAKKAMKENKTLKEVLLADKILTAKDVDALLDPWKMLEPGAKGGGG